MSAKENKPERQSLVERKAMAYDCIRRIEQLQVQIEQLKNNVRTMSAEIEKIERLQLSAPKEQAAPAVP